MTDHPTNGLVDTVHQRHRLGILTITDEARRAEFGYLREALDLTPGNLSRHLAVLEDAGMVKVEKGYEGRRPRTWVSITRRGKSALAAELEALAALVRRHADATKRADATEQPEAANQANAAGQPDSTEQAGAAEPGDSANSADQD